MKALLIMQRIVAKPQIVSRISVEHKEHCVVHLHLIMHTKSSGVDTKNVLRSNVCSGLKIRGDVFFRCP